MEVLGETRPISFRLKNQSYIGNGYPPGRKRQRKSEGKKPRWIQLTMPRRFRMIQPAVERKTTLSKRKESALSKSISARASERQSFDARKTEGNVNVQSMSDNEVVSLYLCEPCWGDENT